LDGGWSKSKKSGGGWGGRTRVLGIEKVYAMEGQLCGGQW